MRGRFEGFSGMSFPAPSESQMLSLVKDWANRPLVLRGIITGTRSHKFLREGETIVTGENKDLRINALMDDLYNVYRLDPTTTNGTCILPVIGTLKFHKGSEFVIHSTPDGVVMGFFMSFLAEYSDAKMPVPEMTFVWVIPKFRRMGVFSQMYSNLCKRKGVIRVDDPNDACKIALQSLRYSDSDVRRYFSTAESA